MKNYLQSNIDRSNKQMAAKAAILRIFMLASYFYSVLFFIFLTLKLCNVIQWSWLWVTAPIWLGLLIYISLRMFIDCIRP